ncbi:MAG: cadmium-translocating P-type ATPase, partial [Gemmobacter sp.]|uniref:heavy metal translocating P-type ATPase n=1 Tax=Gemmobacter sp. TaxID=1898957 RepID=UPI001A48A714
MAHDHSHPEGRLETALTGLTLAGMAAALVDAFLIPGPWGPVGLIVVYLVGGLPTLIGALGELWHHRRLDIDLLMALAALAAALVGSALEGAVLLTLFAISEALEHRAMGRARRAVEALMALRPDTALLKTAEGVTEVPSAQLVPGDLVIVRPGGRVPVDGVIERGEASMDLSTLTGESMPVHRGPGAPVFEAVVNLNGVLEVRVTRSATDSTVARMVALVTEAQAARAPSERFSEWFGQRYTVAVLAGSVLAYAALRFWGLDHGGALYRAATLLVAASPCAIVISVPAAILSALSAAARGGVLFKGGAALETLAGVRAFAFDKTGTLTTGRAEVVAIAAPGMDENAFLQSLTGLEAQSEHPVAAALRRETAARGLSVAEVPGARSLPSEGIVAGEGAGVLWAGNPRMAARMGAALDAPAVAALAAEPWTTIYHGQGSRLLGAVAVADRPRASSREGLAGLRASGVTGIAMMTGDRRAV